MQKHTSADQVTQSIQSGHRVFVHGAAATPIRLLDTLVKDYERLRDVELLHLHTCGTAQYSESKYRGHFKASSFFVGSNIRKRFDPGFVDYIPCFLSEIPKLIRSRQVPIDVALIHVSPPDEQGYCTLGTSVDAAKAATEAASVIIAQINPKMPKTHGDGLIHMSRIHHFIEVDDPLPVQDHLGPSKEESLIGNYCASLIEDGSTIQMGIGSIPDAVLASLKGHKQLGIHSEMWSDGALELIQMGAVDNSQKKLYPGKTVAGFVSGSKALYDFIHDNPSILLLDISYVNNPANICQNPKVVAINSAVEIDLTGQVCSDSIGPHIISGAGGQVDFIRGASLSDGGKPIIALNSRTKAGEAKIVPMLKAGAGVVTSRAHVHYVVTEFGIANLYGKTLQQRAHALINISHPEDREMLTEAWKRIWK